MIDEEQVNTGNNKQEVYTVSCWFPGQWVELLEKKDSEDQQQEGLVAAVIEASSRVMTS